MPLGVIRSRRSNRNQLDYKSDDSSHALGFTEEKVSANL